MVSYHNLTLIEKVKDKAERSWYLQKTVENGWSRNVLVHQIETKLYERQRLSEKTANFVSILPLPLGIILCKEKNKLIAEYSLKDMTKPIGISEYQLLQEIPSDLQGTLPSIAQLEEELEGE